MLHICCKSCKATPVCEDKNLHCPYWASVGECTKNPKYMLHNCFKSCGVCKGWTMVFKAVTGANQKPLDIYKSGGTFNEDQLKALDVTNRFPNDYKNRILLNWEDFGATEAKVVLYKGGNSVKELIFNAKGKNNVNWFYINQLKNTPWSDIRTEPCNLFAIDPKPGYGRSFIINSVYKGCPGDDGWMVITGRGCGWEQSKPHNAILYSKVDGHTNWNKDENVGIADVLAVFVH